MAARRTGSAAVAERRRGSGSSTTRLRVLVAPQTRLERPVARQPQRLTKKLDRPGCCLQEGVDLQHSSGYRCLSSNLCCLQHSRIGCRLIIDFFPQALTSLRSRTVLWMLSRFGGSRARARMALGSPKSSTLMFRISCSRGQRWSEQKHCNSHSLRNEKNGRLNCRLS